MVVYVPSFYRFRRGCAHARPCCDLARGIFSAAEPIPIEDVAAVARKSTGNRTVNLVACIRGSTRLSALLRIDDQSENRRR